VAIFIITLAVIILRVIKKTKALPLAIEHLIVVGYPYCHRNIMATKVRHGMVVSTWIVSAVLTAVTACVCGL